MIEPEWYQLKVDLTTSEGNVVKTSIDLRAGFVNKGDQSKIRSVMRRAEAGEPITVAFLGGSITQGSLSSTPDLCYASRVYAWWKESFPNSEITCINGGIGATDSQFGCARVAEDVLRYEPDMVQVEFAVNDDCNEHFLETCEGVVRQVLSALYPDGRTPALMLMYNVRYDNGASAELMHSKIARHYDLPAVSMRSTIYPLLLSGELENRDITPDDLHPNDAGHELVASVITYSLDEIRAADLPEPAKKSLPAPLTEDRYESYHRYRNNNSADILRVCEGFTADGEPQSGITDIFRNGWTAAEKGAYMEFELEAKVIGLQYRRTIQLPAPVATVTVDGNTEKTFILDANFDETWGDKLCLMTVLESEEKSRHTLRVELTETHSDDELPFYLVSVLAG